MQRAWNRWSKNENSKFWGRWKVCAKTFCWSNKTHPFGNVASDEKAIRTQALLVDPVVPPMPHQLRGHELFDLVAKLNRGQIQALFEGRLINLLDGGGYHNVYECASFECPPPNLLQPIVENHIRQPPAIVECPPLDRLDGGGYHNVYECELRKCPPPNLLQPIVENHIRQPLATPECKILDRLDGGGGQDFAKWPAVKKASPPPSNRPSKQQVRSSRTLCSIHPLWYRRWDWFFLHGCLLHTQANKTYPINFEYFTTSPVTIEKGLPNEFLTSS